MKHEYYTCDVVDCINQAEIMDQVEIPGSKGSFLRHVCKDHLKKLWDMFGCVVS